MLLEIENLKVHYQTSAGVVKAVDGVSLNIDENQVQGIAGESGCGKTTLIKSLLRLLPPTAMVTADKLIFKGQDPLAMPDPKFRRDILWQEISLVPQSAMNSLDPVYKVGDQVIEAIQAHSSQTKKQAAECTAHLFDIVGLQPNLMNSYPHEFSGGMRQRAMIAMSLALDPALIVMDEPTTGLDVLVQERIIRKLLEIREQVKSSILLITHDISVIAEMSNRIGIMYAGRMMELGESIDLFENPYHPYTLGLKNAFPSIKALDKELISIPGSPPNLIGERPADTWINDLHRVACHRLADVADIRAKASEKDTWHSSKSAA